MGLAASQARLLMLTDRSDQLAFQGENIAEKRMQLASETEKLFTEKEQLDEQGQNQQVSGSDVFNSLTGKSNSEGFSIINTLSGIYSAITNNGESSKEKEIDDQLARLEEEDNILQMRLKQVDTQHQAVTTEMDAVQKVIQKNIESTFKLF